MRALKILSIIFILAPLIIAQDWINLNRGKADYRKTVIMQANNVQTKISNWETFGEKGGTYSAVWPSGTLHSHLIEMSLLAAAEVTGKDGNTYHVISESYSENPNIAPDGHQYWWNPKPLYANDERRFRLPDGTYDTTSEIAHKADNTTWPPLWPGKDGSWHGTFNSYFGDSGAIVDDEAYYVADDFCNDKYPYYPFPSDTARRGLGLQCETRVFQWANSLQDNDLFVHFRITNTSSITYNKNMYLGFYANVCPGGYGSANAVNEFDNNNSMVIASAYQNTGTWTDHADILPGYMAWKILQTPDKPDGSGQLGITSFTAPTYGSVWAKNEEQVWAQIQPGVFVNPTINANLLWILASGPFNLSPKQTVPYYACMMFAPDDTSLLTEAKNAKTIYDYNYNPSGLIRFFDAASNTNELGQQNILSIFVSDGSEVELNGQNINGVNQVNISSDSTTTYTLTTKGVVSESKKITVQFIPPGKIKTFSVDNAIVELGVSDSSFINWSASGGSEVTLNGVSVPTEGTEKILPQTTTQYILVAKGLKTDTSVITVQALTTDKVNRALNQKTFSSLPVDGNSPKLAVDGNTGSYWQSQPNSAQWITVDLGKTMNINRIVLNWGALYGTVYQLQAIDESRDTTMLLTNNNGKGGTDDFGGFNIKGRYVRMLILSDNFSSLGCRLNEFQVYGKLITTDVKDNNGSTLPKSFALEQNYPNPFNPSTAISWQLPVGGFVTLKLYDILGKEVASLVNEYQNAGVHSIIFNTQQLKGGRQLSSGIYLYRLQASGYSAKSGNFISTKKMILLK